MFAVLGWNAPAIEFYETLGAQNATKMLNIHFFRYKPPAMEAFLRQ
jgi:hypothetical protein